MERHVKLLGIIFVVWGILSILFGMTIFLIFFATGVISGDEEALAIILFIGTMIAAFSCITGIGEIIAGWGLLERKRWSRILAMIMGVINIIDLPFGTALGIYALWVLLKAESEALLVN